MKSNKSLIEWRIQGTTEAIQRQKKFIKEKCSKGGEFETFIETHKSFLKELKRDLEKDQQLLRRVA